MRQFAPHNLVGSEDHAIMAAPTRARKQITCPNCGRFMPTCFASQFIEAAREDVASGEEIAFIGIVPEAHGAIAVITSETSTPVLYDMPIIVKDDRWAANAVDIASILEKHTSMRHIIGVHSIYQIPDASRGSPFQHGRCLGAIDGVLAGMGLIAQFHTLEAWIEPFLAPHGPSCTYPAEIRWRRAAHHLFPDMRHVFVKARPNRALASLLAHWMKTRKDNPRVNAATRNIRRLRSRECLR